MIEPNGKTISEKILMQDGSVSLTDFTYFHVQNTSPKKSHMLRVKCRNLFSICFKIKGKQSEFWDQALLKVVKSCLQSDLISHRSMLLLNSLYKN